MRNYNIPFNVPPMVGKEKEYIAEAIDKHRISGDGEFTKRCSQWIEEKMDGSKVLLTTSCTHATEMAALLSDILSPLLTPSCCGDPEWFLWIFGQIQ